MKKTTVLTLGLLWALHLSAQVNFYVSPTGSDANAGTSIATAWQRIQHAADNATPGSTVNVMAGTYNELVAIHVSGTPGNPIIFRNYQQDAVTISGAGFTNSGGAIISIANQSNITLQGITLQDFISPFANGIELRSDSGVAVQNVTFKNLKITHIGFTNAPGGPISPSDNAHGIDVLGGGFGLADAMRNIVIDSCEVFGNINGYSENITVNGNVDGFAITNCVVHHNTNIGIELAGNYRVSKNPTFDHVRNGLVARNATYANLSPVANSGGIYCDGCWNTAIERNNTYGNGVGIVVGCEPDGSTENVIVRNNLVYDNEVSGIQLGGYNLLKNGIVRHCVASNNTCFHNDINDDNGELRIYRVDSCELFNNIVYAKGNLLYYIDLISPQNFTSNHNLFFAAAGDSTLARVNHRWNTMSYADFRTTHGYELNSIYIDPLLLDTNAATLDLHIPANSPSKDAGDPSYIPGPSERDFDGEGRANGSVDLGADEFYAGMRAEDAQSEAGWLTAYPNPASRFITLRLDGAAAQEEILSVYNALGGLAHTRKVKETAVIDVSLWPAGVYFVQVANLPTRMKSFVKQ
jgi:Secretion system C-terminal sorting domain